MPSFLVRIFARPYVAGNSLEKGIKKAEQLWKQKGICSTLDLLGEELTSKEEVEGVVNTYLEMIEKVNNLKFVSISLKPTALGVDISKEHCLENLRKILTVALELDVLVTLDMESSAYTDVTLEMYHILRPEFPNFGTVLQTRLFRTKDDILDLEGMNAHIRLCIGIYLEDKDIAYTKKLEMKKKIVTFSVLLLKNNHFIAVATHDEKTIDEILKAFEGHDKITSHVEFQMLLGVPRERIQKKLIDHGFTVRYYVPFATNWKDATNYLKRRLNENPQMAIYTIKNIIGSIIQPFKRHH